MPQCGNILTITCYSHLRVFLVGRGGVEIATLFIELRQDNNELLSNVKWTCLIVVVLENIMRRLVHGHQGL